MSTLFQGNEENLGRLQVQDLEGGAGERDTAGQQRPPRVPGHPVQDGFRDGRVLRGEPEVGAAQDAARAARNADEGRGAGDGQQASGETAGKAKDCQIQPLATAIIYNQNIFIILILFSYKSSFLLMYMSLSFDTRQCIP